MPIESRPEKQRLRYIDGLKGIACLSVMLSHFYCHYSLAQDSSAIDVALFHNIPRIIQMFFSGTFAIYLFFVISGYLIASTSVKSLAELCIKIIIRFLRLALPIFGACIIILIIQHFVGFYNEESQLIIQNEWIAGFYNKRLSLKNAIDAPFSVLLLGWRGTNFSAPWWVLRDMFFASLITYMFSYVSFKISNRYNTNRIPTILLIGHTLLILLFAIIHKEIISSVLAGALLRNSKKHIPSVKYKWIYICILLFIPLSYIIGKWYLYVIAFSCMLISIDELPWVKSAFDKLDILGNISFGVYSLHWPIYCSVGLLFLVRSIGVMEGWIAYLLSILFCSVLTILLAILYHKTIEKWSGLLCKLVNQSLYGLKNILTRKRL